MIFIVYSLLFNADTCIYSKYSARVGNKRVYVHFFNLFSKIPGRIKVVLVGEELGL